MSVLIKGMKMPTRCEKCRCCKPYEKGIYCTLTGTPVLGNGNARLNNCPLVSVPPHGRLIDADVLMETIRAHDYPLKSHFNSTDYGMFTIGIKQAVDEVPTIIPADNEAKEKE